MSRWSALSPGYCCRFGVASTSKVRGVRYLWCAVVVALLWAVPARDLGACYLIPPQLGFRPWATVSFGCETFLLWFPTAVLTFFIAGLLYLLCLRARR